jgi:regulator of cell morphogenesis and NO signaling
MTDASDIAAPHETSALIGHILTRCHAVHRAGLAALYAFAEKVEAVHADDAEVPRRLAEVLKILWHKMEDLMAKEELILFPAMRAGGSPGTGHPVAGMRAEHGDHAANIERIRHIAANLTPPGHACGSWRALHAGTEKLLDDPEAHIAIENDVLFPRFEQG